MTMEKLLKIGKGRGFSLVELMIAMVILAIGILATMAMQFSTLASHITAREATAANDLARSVEEIIRAESRGWVSGQSPSASAVFDDLDGFIDAMGNSGTWQSTSDTPVTVRFDDGEEQRFCVYVAGQQVGTLGDADQDLMRVAIAVVYPTYRGQIPNGSCTDSAITNSLDSSARITLELAGLRSVHLSTAVRANRNQF